MVTIYTITYNEEVILEFFINHYRKMFPDCRIIIYDNESTDKTVTIAKDNKCEVITFCTNNTLQDSKHRQIKNNCWKDSKTNWNIMCDCDELIHISQDELIKEEKLETNIISTEGFTMLNHTEIIDLPKMEYGYRDKSYDKKILFDKKSVKEIRYRAGCHKCAPVPHENKTLKYSDYKYKILHYHALSPTYVVNRRREFAKRLSKENKRKGWGSHYKFSEKTIRDWFHNASTSGSLIKIL